VNLADLANICENESPITLNGGTPFGGTYSGTGISAGSFNPATAGVGNHSITYTWSDGTCGGDDSKTITVLAAPSVTFNVADNEFCLNDAAFNMSAGSPSGGVYSGFGISGNQFSPASAGAGSHSITYEFTNAQGCSDTKNQDFIVFDLPNVQLSNFPNFCEDDAVFTLVQGSPIGGVYSGTGVTGNQFDPQIGAGTYPINYYYQDAHGCDDQVQKDIQVLPLPQAPITAIADINSYCDNQAPDSILLTATGIETAYFWYENHLSNPSFSQKKSLKIAAPLVSTSYLVRGENSCGESSYLQIDIEVKPAPVANFMSSGNDCQFTNFFFTDASTIASQSISQWTWDFGDGASSNETNPSHIYNDYGSHDIQLIVESNQACRDTALQSIMVHPKPQAAFDAPMVCF
ncbi:PKD domain-containing protein, partial [Lentimicrobium sp. S6]|uniref:PKD domain-containing protein n=1 Tax=Lentimicrobium sp. S6 TaxID=2735872 RepID=UPI00155505DA